MVLCVVVDQRGVCVCVVMLTTMLMVYYYVLVLCVFGVCVYNVVVHVVELCGNVDISHVYCVCVEHYCDLQCSGLALN